MRVQEEGLGLWAAIQPCKAFNSESQRIPRWNFLAFLIYISAFPAGAITEDWIATLGLRPSVIIGLGSLY